MYFKNILPLLIAYANCFSYEVAQNGTPPVRWTLYSHLKLTWNEATRFCRDQGGHLPVTNSHLTHSAFGHWLTAWHYQSDLQGKLWLGLYRTRDQERYSFRWERDAVNHDYPNSPVQFWKKPSEPLNLDSRPCVTHAIEDNLWSTVKCEHKHGVVCEFFEECCSYSPYSDVTQVNTVTTSYPNVTSLDDCCQLCDANDAPEQQCILAKWNKDLAKCEHTNPTYINASSSSGEFVDRYLQHCFLGRVKVNPSSYGITDKSPTPKPAGPPLIAPNTFVCTLVFNVSSFTTAILTRMTSEATASTVMVETTSSSEYESATTTSTSVVETTSSAEHKSETTTSTSVVETTSSEEHKSETTTYSWMGETSSSAVHQSETSVLGTLPHGDSTRIDELRVGSLPFPKKGKHLCSCSCSFQRFTNPSPSTQQKPPTSDLVIVEKTATSKHRRRRCSEWTSPSAATIVISVIMVSTSTCVVTFFVCFDLATVLCSGSKRRPDVMRSRRARRF